MIEPVYAALVRDESCGAVVGVTQSSAPRRGRERPDPAPPREAPCPRGERLLRGTAAGIDCTRQVLEAAKRDVLHVGSDEERRQLAVRLGSLDASEHRRSRQRLEDRRQERLGLLGAEIRTAPAAG